MPAYICLATWFTQSSLCISLSYSSRPATCANALLSPSHRTMTYCMLCLSTDRMKMVAAACTSIALDEPS
uniref:Putative secreted protein n=1 Tax=Ixodes ricinus TaxID=34613 RepID=A0A147BJ88_IXORI